MITSYRRPWLRQFCGAMLLGITLTVMLAQSAHAMHTFANYGAFTVGVTASNAAGTFSTSVPVQLVAPTGLPPIEEPFWPNYIFLPAINNP